MDRIQRSFYGATWLLDQIGEKLGFTDDLRTCFPEDYRKILSIAYYLILGDNRAMMYFKYWSDTHIHPYGGDISSQDISRLFASISEESVILPAFRGNVAWKRNTGHTTRLAFQAIQKH